MTPPQYARSRGIGEDKVLAWIHSGELRAINLATKRTGRPRYVLRPEDIEAFELGRSVTPTGGKTRRRRSDPDVIEYF